MLCLRGHYTIDLVTGFIFGHYMFMHADRMSHYVDYGVFKVPFEKRYPHYLNKCGNCEKDMQMWDDPNMAYRDMRQKSLAQEKAKDLT